MTGVIPRQRTAENNKIERLGIARVKGFAGREQVANETDGDDGPVVIVS